MRVIHKGYATTTYGKGNLTISDHTGRVVYQTDKRDQLFGSAAETENGLKTLIEVLIKNGK